MSNICNKCSASITRKSPGIQCQSSCGRFYHCRCVDISVEQLSILQAIPNARWQCPTCQDVPQSPTLQDGLDNQGVNNQQDLYAIMIDIKSQLNELRGKQDEVLTSVSFCSNKVSDFEIALSKMHEQGKIIENLKIENENLKGEVCHFKTKLNDLEQYSRQNNLEIQGVPEKRNENLFDIVHKITDFLSVPFNPNTIESVHRVKAFKPGSPKNIIVKFLSVKSKDAILAAGKNKRASSTAANRALCVDNISNNLYINDHLTTENKLLYKRTREIAKERGYKYVWLKNCNIFIRKEDASRVKIIKSFDQVNSL